MSKMETIEDAARAWSVTRMQSPDYQEKSHHEDREDAFKAGAEWQAKQTNMTVDEMPKSALQEMWDEIDVGGVVHVGVDLAKPGSDHTAITIREGDKLTVHVIPAVDRQGNWRT